MSTKEIPRNEWIPFLDSFSQRHEGWLVTVEVREPHSGKSEMTSELPLEGISFLWPEESGTISINAGSAGSNQLIHMVRSPMRLWLKRTAAADAALEIESNDGTKTLVEFRSALPTGMSDGLTTV